MARAASLYARNPRRFAATLIGGIVLVIMFVVITIALGLTTRYLNLSFVDYALALAAVNVVFPLFVGRGLFAQRHLLGAVFPASPAPFGAAVASEVVAASYKLPRAMATAIVWPAALFVPACATALILVLADDPSWLDGVGVYTGALGTLLLALLAGSAFAELGLQIARAVASPSALGADVRRVGLALRLLALTSALILLAGMVVGALFVDNNRAAGLLEVYGFALTLTLVFMAILSGPLMLTVSGPIARLREGVRSVERGDFDVAVPVTSSDELGELTGRFNEMAASLRRSSSELRASRARIVAAADESRRKVERDLHDGAQQSLVLLNLKLGLLEKRLASDPEAHSAANEIRAELDQALAELRDLAHGIYPQVLTSDGLSAALNHAAAGCAIPASLDSSGTGRYQPEVEAAVYFCCLEALQNAAKYAGDSASARIELTQADDELRFAVSDDGAGFDPLSANGSAGLQNMADRIGALGGELRVESGPGEGTRVVGRVPARNVGLG